MLLTNKITNKHRHKKGDRKQYDAGCRRGEAIYEELAMNAPLLTQRILQYTPRSWTV